MSAPGRLMVFGKVPRAGHTKTRLAPALGEEGAARLYRAFLDDVLELGRSVPAELELWIAPRPGRDDDLGGRRPEVRIRRQAEGGLGARLRAAFRAAFEEGAERALAVGSDHPTLPPGHLREALEALGGCDACVGPTPDGGYWAVGIRRDAWPRAAGLFEDVPWSTPRVLAATMARARRAGVEVARVSAWYDVDEPRDLERLRRDVRPGSATAGALERLGAAGGA